MAVEPPAHARTDAEAHLRALDRLAQLFQRSADGLMGRSTDRISAGTMHRRVIAHIDALHEAERRLRRALAA